VVVLSQVKSNLGPSDVPSLKFTFQAVTVETEDGRGAHVRRLVEMGETERSVTDILTGRGDESDSVRCRIPNRTSGQSADAATATCEGAVSYDLSGERLTERGLSGWPHPAHIRWFFRQY
jgi:hypothetical protein